MAGVLALRLESFLHLRFSGQVRRCRVIGLMRHQIPEAVARLAIEFIARHATSLSLTGRGHGVLEILVHQPFGVFVGPVLPEVVQLAEVAFRARCFSGWCALGELLAPVQRRGLRRASLSDSTTTSFTSPFFVGDFPLARWSLPRWVVMTGNVLRRA